MKTLSASAKQCRSKAMNHINEAAHFLCNASGPLPDPEQRTRVNEILREAWAKIEKMM